ncbi:hypothetical protein M9458_045039, partial [Cirrhinus mrigala]
WQRVLVPYSSPTWRTAPGSGLLANGADSSAPSLTPEHGSEPSVPPVVPSLQHNRSRPLLRPARSSKMIFAEATVKSFIKTYLKLPEDTVENICFERVHRLGAKKPGAPRPRPIVAKFGYFKQKEQVKSRGRELKGTDFSVNDQFPKEILERRKVLFPIRRSLIQKGSRAVIAVDRLYVDGRLYRDVSTTP